MKSRPEPLTLASICEPPHIPHPTVWAMSFSNPLEEVEREYILTLIQPGIFPLKDNINLQFVLKWDLVLVTVWHCVGSFICHTSKEWNDSFGIHLNHFGLSGRIQVCVSLFHGFFLYGYFQIVTETEGSDKKRSAHVLSVEDQSIIRCKHLIQKSLSWYFYCIETSIHVFTKVLHVALLTACSSFTACFVLYILYLGESPLPQPHCTFHWNLFLCLYWPTESPSFTVR